MSKIRPLGDYTFELEDLLDRFVQEHDPQAGEILTWVYNYLIIHHPDSVEVYEDDTSPIFFYGAPESYAKIIERRKKCIQ